MKKLILLLLLSSAVSAFAQKTDYSGNYVINKSKIDFGQAPEWILPKKIQIIQGKGQMIIIRTLLNQQMEEQASVTDTLSYDSTPFLDNQRTPKRRTRLKWQREQSFVVTRESIGADDKLLVSGTEICTLEDGGKTLVINRSIEQADGMKYSIKAVYEKQ